MYAKSIHHTNICSTSYRLILTQYYHRVKDRRVISQNAAQHSVPHEHRDDMHPIPDNTCPGGRCQGVRRGHGAVFNLLPSNLLNWNIRRMPPNP
jgi:hypothetical protein